MISKSFPYFSIAKKHGVDYGDVLLLAEYYTYPGRARFWSFDAAHRVPISMDFNKWSDLKVDIAQAVAEFERIRREGMPS